MAKVIFILVLLVSMTLAQRPGYAGSIPYGYPEIVTTTTTTTAPPAAATDSLGNRFGDVTTSTQRLPIEANGNADLVNQLLQLPIDQQPFWLLNWQALDSYRNHPQTWQVKDNEFLDFDSSGLPSYRSEGDEFRNMYKK